VDDIAAQAGLAKGAVYHHFPTKEAIFEVVFENISIKLFGEVSAAARRASDVLEAMVVGTRAYFDACSKGPTARIILEDGPAVLGWERWREIDQKHFGGSVVQALTQAIKTGLIEKQPVEPLARLLIGPRPRRRSLVPRRVLELSPADSTLLRTSACSPD